MVVKGVLLYFGNQIRRLILKVVGPDVLILLFRMQMVFCGGSLGFMAIRIEVFFIFHGNFCVVFILYLHFHGSLGETLMKLFIYLKNLMVRIVDIPLCQHSAMFLTNVGQLILALMDHHLHGPLKKQNHIYSRKIGSFCCYYKLEIKFSDSSSY